MSRNALERRLIGITGPVQAPDCQATNSTMKSTAAPIAHHFTLLIELPQPLAPLMLRPPALRCESYRLRELHRHDRTQSPVPARRSAAASARPDSSILDAPAASPGWPHARRDRYAPITDDGIAANERLGCTPLVKETPSAVIRRATARGRDRRRRAGCGRVQLEHVERLRPSDLDPAALADRVMDQPVVRAEHVALSPLTISPGRVTSGRRFATKSA